MKYGTVSYSALAAAVALGCGVSTASAQEGVDVDERIEASDEQAERTPDARDDAEDLAREQAEEQREATEDAAEERLEAAEERDEQRQEAAEERQDVAEEAAEGQQETENLAERREEVIENADEALRQLREQNEQAAALLDQAYGHAVFDTTKGGLIVTGAGGTGVARESVSGEQVFMHLGSAGVGLGAGVENYKLVLLFEDEETYEQFVSGQWDGSISAQAAAGGGGAAAEEQFVDGVRAYRITDAGLMAQVDVSGVRFWPSERLNDQETLAALNADGGGRAAPAQQEEGNPERLDELTQEHEDLATFVEAVKAAGMADALTGDTPYTVFAPTDEAFESIAQGDDLLAPENRDRLVDLLRAHIVADDVDEETARSIGEAKTIDGGTVEISAEGERLMVGDASVVEPDIETGNLRVYAIDKVLSEGGPTRVATRDEPQREQQDEPQREQQDEPQREQQDEPQREQDQESRERLR